MGTSDSDFAFHTGDDLDAAARFAAEIDFKAEDGYEYEGYEFTYLINGQEYPPNPDKDDDYLCAETIIYGRQRVIHEELKAEAAAAKKAEEARQAEERRIAKAVAAEKAHKAELELLAKLKAKHEVE